MRSCPRWPMRGKLHEPAVLQAQVKRLLADPRSRALFDGFGAQWLGLGELAEQDLRHREVPADDRRDARGDVRRGAAVLRKHRARKPQRRRASWTAITRSSTAPSPRSTAWRKRVTGPEMRKVKLTDANRGGILGMPGILATTSFPNRTSPVKRGVWVLEQVLGEHVPPAAAERSGPGKAGPEDGRESDPAPAHGAAPHERRLRQLPQDPRSRSALAWRTSTPSAAGAIRTIRGGAIDAAGELPGGKRFASPKELKAIIAARKDDLARNLTRETARLRPVPPARRLRRDRGRSPDGNHRQGRLPHADAHHRDRHQLSFHQSPHPGTRRALIQW